MNQRVVTFGELMLRLSPPDRLRLIQSNTLDATYGGAEANVAVSLAMLGVDAAYVTRLPNNPIADRAIHTLRGVGVDTSRIARGGHRMGIFFYEYGASQRPSTVLYDRAHSAISEIEPGMLDWHAILDGAAWFHFTGITPALSDGAAAVCAEALAVCKAKGVMVSCDVNYRKNLWSRDKACAVMSGLMPHVDLCIANEEDASDVFGIHADTSVTDGTLDTARYRDVAAQLAERFGLSTVAITLRTSVSADDNKWAGMLYTGGECYYSKTYDVHIVDRVGGGDSFGAGLIYATLRGYDPQSGLEFATAASCLQHSMHGDFNYTTKAEIERLVGGDGSGRVRR